MRPEKPKSWRKIADGDKRVFGILQVDIAGHSQIKGSDAMIQQVKVNLKSRISRIVELYEGGLGGWAGDGGFYLFLQNAPGAIDQMVLASLNVVHDLRFFNDNPDLNRISEAITLRVSCHRGEITYSQDPGTLQGRVLNSFLKEERSIGIAGTVTLTTAVFREIESSHLRSRFRIDHRKWHPLGGPEEELYVYSLAAGENVAVGDRRYYADVVYLLNEVDIKVELNHHRYVLTFHKILKNVSGANLSHVLSTVAANRFPHDTEQSRLFYEANPITWDELGLHAWDREGDLDIQRVTDFGARKDYLIQFAHKLVERPVPVGETREFWYAYTISIDKWGPYIERPIGFPTERCAIAVVVPSDSEILAGGYELSPFAPERTISDQIRHESAAGWTTFRWEGAANLVLGNTYVMNWTPPEGVSGVARTSTLDHRILHQGG